MWLKALPLLLIAAVAALMALDRSVPIDELTAGGKALAVIPAVGIGIGALFWAALVSQPGGNAKLGYLRNTRHKHWLLRIFGLAVFAGLASYPFTRAMVGHVAAVLPASEYLVARARVISRTQNDASLLNCEEDLEVETTSGKRYEVCLERGVWLRFIPERLQDTKSGDEIVLYLRRTALGVSATVAEPATEGQSFFVE